MDFRDENIEYAPHQHGGHWERMVKEFKRSMSKAAESVANVIFLGEFAAMFVSMDSSC
jgi:hypothetical protein